MHIETERLLLRSMQLPDVPALVQLWTDPDVTRHMGGPRDPDSLQKSIAEDLQNPDPGPFDLWPVVEKASVRSSVTAAYWTKRWMEPPRSSWFTYSPKSLGKGLRHRDRPGAQGVRSNLPESFSPHCLIDLKNTASEHVAIKAGLHFEKETLRPSGIHMRVYATADEQDTVQTDYPPKSESCGIPELIEGSGLLTWSHVVQRLTEAHTYWVVTTTPKGKPHTTPVWGIWTDGCFYFGTDRNSRQARYLAQNPSSLSIWKTGMT